MIDASIAVKWVVPEDDYLIARFLYRQEIGTSKVILGPPHLPIEVTNALRKKVWQGHFAPDDANNALRTFLRLDFQTAAPPRLYERALELASKYDRRAVYDSYYVALAEVLGCDLWTADPGLVNVMAKDLPFIHSLKDYR